LAGTDGVTYCFWSPDSRFLGFFAAGQLKKMDASGGPPQTLCDAPLGQGAAWSTDGVIVFTPSIRDSLYRVSAAGGTATPLTSLDPARKEESHRWPHFLPDGRHFLYLARSAPQPENSAIYLARLDRKERRLVVSAISSAGYSPPRGAKEGHVLFSRDGALMALPFLPDRMEPAGEPFPVAEQVEFSQNSSSAFSVSHNGALAYLSGSGHDQRQLVWLDRSGKQVGTAGTPGPYIDLRLSPDQKRAAVSRLDPQTGRGDIWIFEFARGITSRFTFHSAHDSYPVWSPDGSRITWGSRRGGSTNLYHKVSSGDGVEEVLLQSVFSKIPWDWSPDGRFVVYSTPEGAGRGRDLWVLPLSGDRKPLPIARSDFFKDEAQFSPDGRWIAFRSNESGAQQIYVQRFAAGSGSAAQGSGGRWQVSTNGGYQPRWRRDGRELYYLAPDRKLMAVEVKSSATFEAGAPRALFSVPIGPPASFGYSYYDVSADGQRFLVNALLEEAPATPITVVLNWTAGVKR